MKVLGISAFYHDSAAALVVDGNIVAAAQEERFSRKKYDAAFPRHAAEYCLAEGGITARNLDVVAFYDKPLLKFDRLLETYLAFWPRGFRAFLSGLPAWLKQKLYIPRELDRGLAGEYQGRYVFLEHHESHAASAFFPSPFERAAILTLDGVGEWTTGSIARGDGSHIEILNELRFPHSLGLLYSAFTAFIGFKVNSGEYKLMGLAPYGEPKYAATIREHLLDLKEDGSFRLNLDYFAYCHSDSMTSSKMSQLFGPPRLPMEEITQRHMDLAASVQLVTEEIVLGIGRHAHRLTGLDNLTMAGGVAINCVANGRLLREGPFRRIWVQPAAGDAGAALGAALFVTHQLAGMVRSPSARDRQKGSFLGPAYSSDAVRRFLDSVGAVYVHYEDEGLLADRIAELVAAGEVLGHFAGRMEFGPRALGARSILADPRSPTMQRTLNLKIKFRESFRPFAPAVLDDRAAEIFDIHPDQDSPYMLFVAPVRDGLRTRAQNGDASRTGLSRVSDIRSSLPAVTHVDYSARIQTVDRERNPRLHRILRAFEHRTGCPVVINTSLNVRGEPIVNSPAEAYRCLMGTDMDALVIESFVLRREDQPRSALVPPEAYRATFSAD
jgi:carbamoyltransferase